MKVRRRFYDESAGDRRRWETKLAAEAMVKDSGIPWSILRATQFHYLVDLFFQAATKLPLVALLPTDLRCQSIAESEVARRLCEIAVACLTWAGQKS